MELTTDWLGRLLHAFVQLWLNPFYYAAVILIVLQIRRQIMLERKLFHAKLHSLFGETWRAVLFGWAAGIGGSLLMALVGAALSPEAILILWAVAILLVLCRVRFLCLAYSAGVIGLLQQAVVRIPGLHEQAWLAWLTEPLSRVDVPSLFALVGVLHLAEAFLVRWQGERLAVPLFLEGRRGKIIGGYELQGFWPIPLFLLVPTAGGAVLPWTPLWGGALSAAGAWSWIAFPAVIGFTQWTAVRLPQDKLRRSFGLLLGYSAVILTAAAASRYWPVCTIIAGLASIVLHEAVIWLTNREEANRHPYFIHGPEGLKILAVLPGSPAAEMELLPGESLVKVNGMKVRSMEELHQALQLNPAFCRLEVLNREGQSKFASRALYAGEHHQLGLVMCPDEHAQYYYKERNRSPRIARLFHRKWLGLTERGSARGM